MLNLSHCPAGMWSALHSEFTRAADSEEWKPIAGDVTSQILLWDAGTEVNEEPGLGPNQAPLQPAPNTGPAEHGVVRPINEVKDGFHYPSVAEVLRVTITPGPMATR